MSTMLTVKIAEVAQKRGITTAYQLQKALDIPPAMAAKLWSGQIKMIGIGTIDKLCSVLRCKADKFLVYEADSTDASD